MNNVLKIVLIVILSIFALALIGVMVLLLNSDFRFKIDLSDRNLTLVDSLEAKGSVIEDIKFDLRSSDIEILKSLMIFKYLLN